MQLAHSHLLNMTTVTLSLQDQHQLSLAYQIDLSAAFKTREAYYEASLLTHPLQTPAIQAVTEQLSKALILRINGEVYPVKWTYQQFAPAQVDQSTYQNMLMWPMTRIQAQASLPDDLQIKTITGQFGAGFRFEEPIALTIKDSTQQMTRWLITMQQSPDFVLDQSMVQPQMPSWQALSHYFVLGFEHILPNGYDHLLFIFLLVLVASSVKQSLLQLTIFTCAHSITLALAFFGVVQLPSLLVELLIVASILYLDIEAFRGGQHAQQRYALIFAFGLMHGMGFASALSEQTLPQYGVLLSLLLFNLGIEMAQIVMAMLSMLLIAVLQKTGLAFKKLNQLCAAVAAVLSIYWAISLLP